MASRVQASVRNSFLWVADKGVENDDVDELGEGIEISHSGCIVYLSRVVNEKDETAYLVPDNTISTFPWGIIFSLLHPLMPI